MNRMAKNISWLTFSSVAVKPIWFVFITYVCIRYMGLEQYGAMMAALALMSICDGSLTLGSSPFTIRELARSEKDASRFFSNFLISRIFFSLVAVGIGVAIRYAIGGTAGIEIVLYAGFYVLARNVLDYCRAIYRAREVFQYEAYSTILEKVLVVGFGTVALVKVPTASSALLGMSIGMLASFLLNFGWVVRKLARFRTSLISVDFFRSALPKAIPLGLSSIFVLLYYRTDSIMIEAIQGELVAGQYAIAFRITEAMVLLPYIATAILLPRLSSLHDVDSPKYKSTFRNGMLGLGSIALLASATVYFLSPFIIPLIDSSAAAEPAIRLLQILVIAFFLSSINQLLITNLTATNRQNVQALILAFAATCNIGLNFWLIPKYSATGAALATIATQIVIGVLFSVIAREKRV